MNPSTAQAVAMVDALIRFGITDAVLSPGSRSAPLAFALAAAERQQRIRLHVRIDERSAGYLALGLAKASGRPVPVVVTSGTAVANLWPAVVEASYAGVPLMVLSADRPPQLRGAGASQTIDQLKIFGDTVRFFVDVATAGDIPGQPAYWRSVIGRAAAAAIDPADPGPAHLNLPFAEPLVPGIEAPFDEQPSDSTSDGPWIRPFAAAAGPPLAEVLQSMGLDTIPERGLVVVGDIPGVGPDWHQEIAHLADVCGWPIIAEPTAGMHRAANWLPAGPLIAGSTGWIARHRPRLIVSVGRIGLTRPVGKLLRSAEHHLAIDRTARWADPGRTASAVVIGSVPIPPGTPDGERSDWLAAWAGAAETAARCADELLDAERSFTGLHVARQLWAAAGQAALLFLASSWPIRQVYLTARQRGGLRVMGNRGANGIDGLVSTAWGAAVSHGAGGGGPTVAMLGDVAFLHDSNGLLAPAEEDRPELTLVVTDNDGGGIFSQLEQGSPAYAQDFERVFGTPHGLHLVGRSRLSGVPARGVSDAETFAEAMSAPAPGVSVLVARVTDRASEAALMARMQGGVAQALERL